jgi:hypothetical protein
VSGQVLPDASPGLSSNSAPLDQKARDDLRRVLIRDDAGRGAIASTTDAYRDQNGQN